MPAKHPMIATYFEHCRYWVSSENDPEVRYLVDVLEWKCDCWSCRKRQARLGSQAECKHFTPALRAFAIDMRTDILAKMRKET